VSAFRLGAVVTAADSLRRLKIEDILEILNQTSKNRYDFSYLRIDFAKNTNVGYAFVNFQTPEDIIPFVEKHQGKPWTHNNRRLVELSYATVQGFDCLVEKFRNSAIMQEFWEFTPKLWYTSDNLNGKEEKFIGTEMEFPGVNNATKKKRSEDNAAHIGLYPPHSARNNRERGRRSHYDRGTPAQIQEEAFYNQASPGSNNNGYGPAMSPGMPGASPMQYQPNGWGYQSPGYFNGYGGPQPYGGPQFFGGAQYPPGDPFYNGAYGNAFINSNFGAGQGAPASRLRTLTDGRLGNGGHDANGGPVQQPESSSEVVGKVEEVDNSAYGTADGFNPSTGPFYMPRHSMGQGM
jgi:hypothetical protein